MKLSRDIIKEWIQLIILVSVMTVISGCSDFFAQKPTEIESKAILDELGQVRQSPHAENPMPELYRQPATRLAIKDGVKLFYFTKHHLTADLAGLVQQQMSVTSSINPATNQVVA